MPKYFFDILTTSGRIDDAEGIKLPDLESARAEAVRIAYELRDEIDDASAEFEITNANGVVLLKLPFRIH
jgi:hypothetical protein